MKRLLLLLPGLLLAIVLLVPPVRTPTAAAPPRAERFRSPGGLAVLPGGRRVLVSNSGTDSVSLVDLEAGKVLAEAACARRPAAVACSADGRHAAVSNQWSGTVSLYELDGALLKPAGEVSVGPLPGALCFAGSEQVFVAVSGGDEVVAIDRMRRQVTQRWPAPREPRALALAPDGTKLAAASSRSADVRLWDVRTGKLLWKRHVEDAFNLRGLTFSPDGKAVVCTHTIRRSFPVSRENIDRGWVIDSRLTRLPIDPDAAPAQEQIALDKQGAAVGDPHGVAFDSTGRLLLVTASGTHELLRLDAAVIPWADGSPGDFLDQRLERDDHFRRLPLGGRPLALAALPEGRAVVVNSLRDAVQVIDVSKGKLIRTITLGPAAEPTLARRGEALFYDAQRSHNQWFSCHTCHSDGHTCGLRFDTLNDDTYGNAKLTPSLRGVTHTGPWTWHGWQKDLAASVKKSYTQTLFGLQPRPDEVRAVVAFLETLDHPPPLRSKDTEAVRRGRALFEGKARCVRCHPAPEYTSNRTYDVGLDDDDSPYPRWNPPSLRGVWDRGPYLHDGRAETLEEVLTGDHAPTKVGGAALTPAELRDLVAFLKTL